MNKFIITVLFLTSTQGFSMIIDNVDDVRADWRINSDRVMGGVSDVYFNELEDESGSFYRLSGDVRTANNGGFIQSLMVLNKDFKKYKGIRLKVRGNGEKYLIWIRTPAARFPWDRYSYEFLTKSDWSEIEVPFSDFQKTAFYMPRSLNQSKVRTMAIAAYGKDFFAEVDIAKIELY
ncbi:MAG: CIA30 family protein [SAR86 cluster bacterium]|nr:CIA30 family protein [SAR86 cluster bacterium]MDG2091771.1 CIA30 family protein [SAR86 cluster bacterium]